MQASNLVLKNTAAANVTFGVEQISPTNSSFVNRAAGVPAAFERIRIKNTFANGQRNSVNRSEVSIAIPLAKVESGVTSVDNVVRARLEIIIPETATALQRTDMYAYLQSALSTTMVTGALRDLDPLY